MGKQKIIKLYLLAAIFLITTLVVYGWRRSPATVHKPDMAQYFKQIGPYTLIRIIPLRKDLVEMLKLDSYLFADYANSSDQVTLYIGYYYTAGKAYAAHSPLVCYPSQGWRIEEQPVRHTFTVGRHTINYEEITTAQDELKELVIYWYQAGPFTNTQVYRNKIDMGYNKFVSNNEQHAFVRITVNLRKHSRAQAQKIAEGFISAFYPKFVRFTEIQDNNS